MTEHRHRKQSAPDAILEDYLQDLLGPVPEEPEPQAKERSAEAPAAARAPEAKTARDESRSGPAPVARERRETPRKATVRRPEPRRIEVAERPRLHSPLTSPSFRAVPTEAPRPVETATEPNQAPEEAKPQTKVQETPATPEPQLQEAPTEALTTTVAEAESTETEESGVADSTPPLQPWKNGRPAWAQDGFDCLFFSVSGLKLAVPLVLLGAIHKLDEELTAIPGRPDWFMGMLIQGDRNIRVVDTARWVMPQRYPADARSRYQYVIRLDESDWGLACDNVAQSFRLQPDEVKWRSEGGRRPWLAGTVKEHMCALLDVARFNHLLARAEKEQHLDLD
ncbi:chemotaxis protein CheW [Marinobacteraceae bacterium S3BR75-40.1]